MAKPRIVGIAIADLHFSLKPPLARSLEPDWLECQRKLLRQLRVLQKENDNCPIICSGDIFDRWNSPCELINFLIDEMPVIWSVAGNHDLPCHSYEDISKSSYWTLCQARKIINMKPGGNYGDGAVTMHAFPYGSEVKPLKKNRDLPIEVAVIHDYIWTKETGYEGALEEKRLKAWGARLKGYDIALFGDNHKSILSRVNDCTVINPGSFMRRKMDEREYRPCVGLIYNTKEKDNVQRHYLDHSGDIFLEEEQVIKAMSGIGTESFLEELSGLSDAAIDFGDAVKRILDRKKVSDTVKKIILSLVDKKKF